MSDCEDNDCWGDETIDISAINDDAIYDVLKQVNKDIIELNYCNHLKATIKKYNLDGIWITITIDKNILEENFTPEQLDAMAIPIADIDVTVHVTEFTIKVLQQSKPNVVSDAMTSLLNNALIETKRNYSGYTFPYDVNTLEVFNEIDAVGLGIHATLKFNGDFDKAYIYVIEHINERLNIINTIISHNTLAFIAHVFCSELPNICNHCMLCQHPLDYECIKPTICGNKLCQIQFSSMGIGFSLENEIVNNGKVTDLLISLFVITMAKLNDDRIDRSFFANYDISKDRLDTCISLIPPVQAMADMIAKKIFVDEMNKLDPFMIPLLRWIIASNTAYLKTCEPNEITRVNGVKFKEVFIMKTSTIAKEKIFEDKKTKYGVRYLFHGSACHNWHLILKNGLKNYSNTKYMTCGAAYGSGIYLSSSYQTSVGYSVIGGIWKNSMYGKIAPVALCEVAEVPELSDKTCTIFTLTDENALITRYLLI